MFNVTTKGNIVYSRSSQEKYQKRENDSDNPMLGLFAGLGQRGVNDGNIRRIMEIRYKIITRDGRF